MPDREDLGHVDLYDDSLLLVKQKEGSYYLYWREDVTLDQRRFICGIIEDQNKRKLN